jgi:hypothetical protein
MKEALFKINGREGYYDFVKGGLNLHEKGA